MACCDAALVRLLCKELHDIQSNPIDGIRVIANEQNITDVQAEMEGPTGTPFEGGLFKLRLTIPSEYPNVPPKGYFITKVFHPNVSTAGEICVNVLKKDWTADMGIRHVLVVIRCLLVHTNPESALNEEAGRLLLEDYEEFARHAKLMTSIHAQRRPGPLTASGGNANTQPQTDASDKANNSSPASKKAKADQGQNASQPSKASAHPVAAGKVKKSLKRL